MDSVSSSISVSAAPAEVAAVITDFAAYPQWVNAVSSAEILEEITEGPDKGLARVVEFHLDAGLVRDVYSLRYSYIRDDAGELRNISWQLVNSQSQKSQEGSYVLTDNEAGHTSVTYSLSIELKIPMLGLFKRTAQQIIMDIALKELKKRVEHIGQ